MSKNLYLYSCLSGLLLISAVHAETPATRDELVVSVSRKPISLLKLGQSVTVLTEDDILNQQALQVSDLLAKTPDLHVIRYGGPGQTTSSTIRGAESDQTLYILDGIKLSDPSQVGGNTNLGLIGTEGVSRIEVLRGPYSTLWGSRALGGVVAITTRDPQSPFEARARIEGGSDYNNQALSLGGKTPKLNWNFNAGQAHDKGVSAFAGGTEPDGSDQSTLSGKADYRFSDTLGLKLYVRHSAARTAYDGFPPPFYSFADTAEFNKIKDLTGALSLYGQSFGGKLDQSLTFSEVRTDSRFFNDDKTPNFISRGDITALDYTGHYRVDEASDLLWVLTHERDEMTTRSPSSFDPNPLPFTADTSRISLAVEGQHAFQSGLNLNLALRHEDDGAYGTRNLGHFAISQPISDHVSLRASVGQGFKAPSLYQLYSDYGNKALKPETSLSYEGGLDVQLGNGAGQIGVVAFSRTTRDQIGFFSCFGSADPRCPTHPFGFYDNIARTKASGIEVDGRYSLSTGTLITGNLSQLRSFDDAPSSLNFKKDLSRRPRTLANLDVTQAVGDKLTLGAGYGFVGQAWDDYGNTRRLKAYGLLDLRAAWALSPGSEVYGRIENAMDSRYATATGYGVTARRVWIGLRVKIK